MNKKLFVRILVCIFFFGLTLYSYVDKQNRLTQLRIALPRLSSELTQIKEENVRLSFNVKQFESPENLYKLAQLESFSHLKYPFQHQVLTLSIPMEKKSIEKERSLYSLSPKPTLASCGK